jgi:hypothetical protein
VLDGHLANTPEAAKTAACKFAGPIYVVNSQIHAGGRGAGRFEDDPNGNGSGARGPRFLAVVFYGAGWSRDGRRNTARYTEAAKPGGILRGGGSPDCGGYVKTHKPWRHPSQDYPCRAGGSFARGRGESVTSQIS